MRATGRTDAADAGRAGDDDRRRADEARGRADEEGRRADLEYAWRGDLDDADRRATWRAVLADLGYTIAGGLAALLLLYYLHVDWQPQWALGCGFVSGVVLRRLVAPSYERFPPFLRRPLNGAVVLLGAVVASWATLAAPQYGFFYAVFRWEAALALPAVAIFMGLGIASFIYATSRLQREVAERQRLEEDLRLAYGIQQSLLRSDFPVLPWLEVRALNVPSRSVGGDYYEIISSGPDALDFAVGDVSGKGVPAALLMSTLQSAFLGIRRPDSDLAEVCTRLNRFLVERTSPERYATFFVGRVLAGERLLYVNAGHNPPLLIRDGECRRLSGGGKPLGLFDEAGYELQTAELRPGDLLVCYTDGVTEARTPDGDEFGEGRLITAVEAHRDGDIDSLVAGVRAALRRHIAGAPQADDITLMVLRRPAPAKPSQPAGGQ